MKPILFNTEMVRAILEGRKTVTRRVITRDRLKVLKSDCRINNPDIPDSVFIERLVNKPYEVNDILYVRETWCKGLDRVLYKADYPESEKFYKNGKEILIKWKPSIHMPKAAARIFLRVTSVRVERLHDITDPEAEGIKVTPILNDPEGTYYRRRVAFKELWDSTIRKDQYKYYCWDVNPYVWVIEFERVAVDGLW